MIHGVGAPKFYIYDSTGVTLQKTITMSANILADKPIIDETRRILEFPYTKTRQLDTANQGYHYRQTLTAGIGDYNSTLLQYQADQANDSRRNDIFKLQQVLTYCNAGYVIKYTPHADLEDLWGFSPMTVFVTLEDLGYTGTNKTDSISVTVEGTPLTSSAFLWYEFSFTELNGVTNANQCISLNGTTQYLIAGTQYSIGTTHSIEFWTKAITFTTKCPFFYGTTGGTSELYIDSTNLNYKSSTSSVLSFAHGATLANLNQWVIVRSGTSVSAYLNNVQIGTTQTLSANTNTYLWYIGFTTSPSNYYYGGKIAPFRIYQSAITSTQRALQYNSGYGNHPLNISSYAIYENNGTGGTSTTEDNQETTASRDLTLTNSPTRTTL